MIEVKNISKTYGKKKNAFQALKNISLKIPAGMSVAILGKSGSGKSTLMHAIAGLDRPETGQVIIDGEDILKLSAKKVDQFRSHKMSFIFQAFFVQGAENCYNNVSLPLEIAKVPYQKRKIMIETALKKVEMLDKMKSRARDLSGGQKQRLAVARAIVNNPSILFADEPTGNLDSATGEVVEDLLFGFNKQGMTLIIVTHDAELAAKCRMQIHIKDGLVQSIKKRAKT